MIKIPGEKTIAITETHFLIFEECILPVKPEFAQHRHFRIWNKKKQCLGWINYHPDWKKYVFTTNEKETIFDISCLEDIVWFMGWEVERKLKRQECICSKSKHPGQAYVKGVGLTTCPKCKGSGWVALKS